MTSIAEASPAAAARRRRGPVLHFIGRLFREKPLGAICAIIFVLFLILGSASAFLHPWLARAFAVGLAVYLLAGLASAVHAAQRVGDVIGVLGAFITLHVAYGSGYLRGILDFVLFRREPQGQAARSSR